MIIGVVSDTHSRKLPPQMLEDFKKADVIIHAGDFCSLDIWEDLKKIKEVKAVYGNMDGREIRDIFPRRQVLKFAGHSIGLFHGEGAVPGLLDRVKAEFKETKVEAVIFGHSHHPLNEVTNGVLYFNPGSPSDTVFAPYCSYGILELTPEGIKGKIIKVK